MLGWPRTAIVGLRGASIAAEPRNTIVWSVAFRTLTQYGLPSSSSIPWNCNGSMAIYFQSEEQARYNSWEACYLCGHLLWAAAATRAWGVVSRVVGSHAGVGQQVWHDEHWLLQQYCWGENALELHILICGKLHSPCARRAKADTWAYMDKPRLPPRSPALGASASSNMSRRGCTKEHFFSEANMETINMDNRLKDLVKIDSKMVKKYVRSWISNISCLVLLLMFLISSISILL